MALFSKKNGTKEADNAAPARQKKEATSASSANSSSTSRNLSHVLRHARITEKATMHSEAGVYIFDIAERATKRDVMQAVQALYKVTPRKVAIVPVPSKTRRSARTGKSGMKRGGKKAYVYLKKGEQITIG